MLGVSNGILGGDVNTKHLSIDTIFTGECRVSSRYKMQAISGGRWKMSPPNACVIHAGRLYQDEQVRSIGFRSMNVLLCDAKK